MEQDNLGFRPTGWSSVMKKTENESPSSSFIQSGVEDKDSSSLKVRQGLRMLVAYDIILGNTTIIISQ